MTTAKFEGILRAYMNAREARTSAEGVEQFLLVCAVQKAVHFEGLSVAEAAQKLWHTSRRCAARGAFSREIVEHSPHRHLARCVEQRLGT